MYSDFIYPVLTLLALYIYLFSPTTNDGATSTPNTTPPIAPSPVENNTQPPQVYTIQSSTQPEAAPPEFIPKLEGDPSSICKGKFNIEIQSIYYYPEEDKICAAVVFKTSFVFHDNGKLKYAMCPIKVTCEPESKRDYITFLRYHPSSEEFVQVDYHRERKQWILNPHLNISGVGGIALGSIQNSSSNDKACVISLNAVNYQGDIPSVRWYYRDKSKSYYPSDVKLLLVIQKLNTSGPCETWFPFELWLTSDLRVDVHGSIAGITKWKDRLVSKPTHPEGWRFKIQGQYCRTVAEEALKSVQSAEDDPNHIPKVGLRDAARSFRSASTTPQFEQNPPLAPTDPA